MVLDLELSLSRKSYDGGDEYSAKKKGLKPNPYSSAGIVEISKVLSLSLSTIQRNILEDRRRRSMDEYMKTQQLRNQLVIMSSPSLVSTEQQRPSTRIRLGGRNMMIFSPPPANNAETTSPNRVQCDRNSSNKRTVREAMDSGAEELLLGYNGGGRKKLRLTEEQSAVLEHTFTKHPTVDNRTKLALAEQLNLKPRQVEVWFQNRRARTKLKQTEVHYEYLKSFTEKLTVENQNLKKELHQYRSIAKFATPERVFLTGSTTFTLLCPSCDQRHLPSDPPTSSSLPALTHGSPSTTVVSAPTMSNSDTK